MVIEPDGAVPLPWLGQPLRETLQRGRGHALLVHAAPGLGALEFALILAQSHLCESRSVGAAPVLACGHCPSCHHVQSRLHLDLRVLLPEVDRLSLNWRLPDDRLDGGDGEGDGAKAKKKPSRQIRIDEVRDAVDWVAQTSSRGRAKVLVLHPAEKLNLYAGNALLKTLEEPPAGVRIILTASDPANVLPTVRSRCQILRLETPSVTQGMAWLQGQGLGVDDAQALLTAASGRPLQAAALAAAGIQARTWCDLPRAVQRGHASAFAGWPLPLAIDTLQRICHDALCLAVGAPPQFFPAAAMPAPAAAAPLLDWQRELSRLSAFDEHPWNDALLMESMVAQGRAALSARDD